MPNLQLGNLLTAGNALLAFPNKYSFNFDGSNDYLDCGTSLGNTLGNNYTGTLTISMWVKYNPSVETSGGLFYIGNFNGYGEVNIYAGTSNRIIFHINDAFSDRYTFALTDASTDWKHIAFVIDASVEANNKVYLNGVDQELTSGQSPTFPLDFDFSNLKTLIGAYYNLSNTFEGLIDEVAIWDTALSASDIAKIASKPVDFSKASTYATDRTSNLKLWLRAGDKAEPESNTAIARQDFYTDFDGTDDHIAGVTQSFTGVFSVSMWIRPNNVTDSGVGILGTTTGDSNYIRQFSQNVAIRIASAGATYGTGNVLVADKWIHLAITRDSSDALKWYVNGDYTGSSATQSGTFTFNHFARSASAYFDGAISNLALFNTTLDAQTISQMAKSRFTPMRDNRFSVVDFDGSNDFINISSSLTPSALTFTMWVATVADSSYRTFIQCGDLLISKSNGNKVHVNKSGVAGQNSTTSFVANEWTHIAITADSSGTKVYRNGVLDLDGSAIAFTAGDILIGKYSGGQFTSGSISSVAYYSSVKSAEEVYALYSKGITYNESSESGLVGYWRMGDDTSKAYPTIADSSSNSNDGTITNGASDDIVQQMVAGYDMGAFENSSEELGGELNPNPTFSNFTGDVPDGWTVVGDDDAGNNISQGSAGGLRIQSDGSAIYAQLADVTTSGKMYKYSITLANLTDDDFNFNNGGTTFFTANGKSEGTYTGHFEAVSTFIRIIRLGSCDGEVTAFSVKEVLQSEVSDTFPAIIDVNEPILGVEEITNGTFDADSNWTKSSVTISGGKANFSSGGTTALFQDIGSSLTGMYFISFDITDYTSGTLKVYGGGQDSFSDSHLTEFTAVGSYVEGIYLESSFNGNIIFGGGSFTGSIDNVSVKPIQGHVGTMTNQDSADLVYSSVLPDQSFLTGVNSAYNFIEFDGTDQYIDCGDIDEMDGVAKITVMGWAKRLESNDRITFEKSTGLNDRVGLNLDIDGVLYANVGTGSGGAWAYASLSGTDWNHIAMVYDGTQADNATRLNLYINGVKQSSNYGNTIPATTASTSGTFKIGRAINSSGHSSTGSVGSVNIFNKALSEIEVNAIYTLGRHGNLLDSYSDNLLGYWAMSSLDSKTGLSDSISTIYDRSGNSNHGTPTNADAGDLKSSPNAEPNGYAKGDTNRSTTTP